MAGMDETRLTVPKFSSFKAKERPANSEDKDDRQLSAPKFSSFKAKETPVEDEDRDKGRRRDDDRKRHHRSTRDRDHHHSKRRRHESPHRRREEHRRSSRSPGRRAEQARAVPPRSSDEAKSDLFFLDKKGDPLIIKYGGIERSKIPAYHRYGRGRVLGTTGRLIIHRDGPRDQFSLRMPGEGSGRFGEKEGLKARRLRLRQQPPLLRPRRETKESQYDGGGDFLPLGDSKGFEGDFQDSSSSEDEDQPNYRSIDGKAKARPLVESESSDDPESEDEALPLDQTHPLKWRSIQLSRQVKDHPEDIDSWMELVEHQNTLLRAGQGPDQGVLENEAHSYSEIKVAMLESALSHATKPQDRSRVLTYLMREGVKVWNSKTATKKWSDVHGDETHDFLLWKTHLDFCMSDISSFQYDHVKQMLITRLRETLSRSSSTPRPNDFSEAIYIFLRATRFIHDAGYKELAVAAWQALLEITFFRPHAIGNSQDAMVSFQDFWESEGPRLGDTGASGWRHFVESGHDANIPEPAEGITYPERESDPYKAWANTESLLAHSARFPARTMDEGTEDDPFRVVMFTDIEPLLFMIPASLLQLLKDQVLGSFLIFCGLPPLSVSDEWIDTAWLDQFLTGPRKSLGVQGVWELEEGQDVGTRKPPSFTSAGCHTSCVTETLFRSKDWFSYLGSIAHFNLDWILNITKQLVHGAGIRELSAYHLSLSSINSTSNIRKVAKTLLKQYPTSMELYNAYAIAEHAQGNEDVAVKVLSSATDMRKAETDDSLLLWRTWAWMELEAGHKHLAVKRLCSSADEFLRKEPDDSSQVSGSHILKARQMFSSYGGDAATGNSALVRTHAEALALLAYLTIETCTEPMSSSQGSISAAMESVDKSCHELKFRGGQGGAAHEGLLQFAARLLYYNATKGPFRRAYMRGQLVKFMDIFPRNTIFQTLLEWSDSSLRVVDETRTLLHDKVLVPQVDCVSSRLFAIEHELRRGNVHTTRAAYEQAVASDASRSSVQVWRGYIRFCHAHGELRAKAKEVFYRALRNCPWSKEVMMEAFGTLANDMTAAELRSVYDTMSSKGMRIHTELEDFLENPKKAKR